MPRFDPATRLTAIPALAAAAALGATVCAASFASDTEDTIRVVSWGGAYEAAQQRAIFGPFAAATGTEVEVLVHDGGLEALETRAGPEGWDAVDLTEDQAIAACRAGLLRRLDHDAILEPVPGVTLERDFMPGSFRRCSVAQNAFAAVIAYNDDAFPGVKPKRVEDFFDLDGFPGGRAVERSPDAILEWALMAEGVPASQVYDLLSTDRGLRLAFRKLDEIRDAIVWWEDVAEPSEMLRRGQASMAAGYNGRFFAAARDEGAPIVIVWDGRIVGYEVWAIPEASPQPAAAEAFVRFATAPQNMARLAENIPYGPTRRSAMDRIGLEPEKRFAMRDHLPNAPRHGARALVRDSDWYASTAALRQRRFKSWLERQ